MTCFSIFANLYSYTDEHRPRPTAEEIEEYKALADAYDAAMEAKGDERRAYRGSSHFWQVEQHPEAKRDAWLEAKE